MNPGASICGHAVSVVSEVSAAKGFFEKMGTSYWSQMWVNEDTFVY